jgi:hypothetical protein
MMHGQYPPHSFATQLPPPQGPQVPMPFASSYHPQPQMMYGQQPRDGGYGWAGQG